MSEHTIESAVAAVDGFGRWMFSQIALIEQAVQNSLGARSEPRRSDLEIAEVVAALIAPDESPVVGAGFVAAADTLVDAPYWLEWWTQGRGRGTTPQRLSADVDPASPNFRDYTTLPWFVVPQESGAPHVTGPYVDYVCTDEYTLTFTAPVTIASRFVGVAGADVYVRWVDEQFGEQLAKSSDETVLVNAAGRVVTSAGRWVAGDLVRSVPVVDWYIGTATPSPGWTLNKCATVPFAVLSHQSPQPSEC